MNYTRIIVTGGSGFIGSHFVRMALERWRTAEIVNLDLLTYAGNPANLDGCGLHSRYSFVHGDIRDPGTVQRVIGDGCDALIHFAAESHVDRSILSSDAFLTTNILGTRVLLDACRDSDVGRFLFISTDEVYGSQKHMEAATEFWPIKPNSPYSVSKASADMLVRSYYTTYGFPGIVTRCTNNYGPYQFPEKLIPLFTTNLLEGKPVPLYGDGLNERDWIHVTDHCEAIATVLERGRVGDVYNVGGGNGRANREIAETLVRLTGKDGSSIVYVEDRPGHDRRYAVDSSKITAELGWEPRIDFTAGLASTVHWYRENTSWWKKIKSGAYREYYETMYGRDRQFGNQRQTA